MSKNGTKNVEVDATTLDNVTMEVEAVEEIRFGRKNETINEKWKKVDELTKLLKENEETWQKRTREETSIAKKKEKEERLKKVAEKKRKFGAKLGKESNREKKENEEKLRRKLALIEVKKNLWRTYRVEGRMIKLDDYYTKRKNEKENEDGEEDRKEEKKKKAKLLKDSWQAMVALLKDIEENGDDWEQVEPDIDIDDDKEDVDIKEKKRKNVEERDGEKERKKQRRGQEEEESQQYHQNQHHHLHCCGVRGGTRGLLVEAAPRLKKLKKL